MDLEQMKARLEEVSQELRDLDAGAKDRTLTEVERPKWEAGLVEVRNLRDQIKEIEGRLDNVRNLATGRGGMEDGTDTDPWSKRQASPAGVYGGLLTRAQRQIDAAHRSGQLPDHGAEKALNLVTTGSNAEKSLAARWVVYAGAEAYRSAFAKMLADPIRGHLLWEGQEADAYRNVAGLQAEMRAMSLTAGNGGYMVPMTLDPTLNLTNTGSISPIRRMARVVQTVTKSWTGLTSAGATSEWKAEATQVADGSPAIDDTEVPVYFGDSFVPYSFEVGMDALDFLQELQAVLVDSADNLMAAAYTTGPGTTTPKGIVTALAAASPTVVIPSIADEVFGKGDVYALQNALPARFSANAQWAMHLATINATRAFETTNGAKEFPELANGQLLGRPLNELSNMDGSVTADVNNYLAVYGDWSQFVIVDRIGTTLELIPNLMGANQRPTGQRGALLWFRTGSDVLVPNAFRMLNVVETV